VYWLPVIRASIALQRRNPDLALEQLNTSLRYELGVPPPLQTGTLYPVYLRGLAYLQKKTGKAAAAEFQRILDHHGVVLNNPLGSLACLQIARSRIEDGDRQGAVTAYEQFLNLWKGADPDVPLLRQAKAEYARAQ